MTKTISAIYEAGYLQLLEPLILPDSTQVQVQIIYADIEAEHTDQQSASFHHCLVNIHRILTEVEQHWSVDFFRQSLPHLLQNELRMLWYLCTDLPRKLCAMLELSAKHLDETRLTREQLEAFRLSLDLLTKDELTETDLKTCRRHLVEVGLPPRFTLPDSVVQNYVDER